MRTKGMAVVGSTMILLFITGFSDGLSDVRLVAPSYALLGENVVLRCNYILGNDTIYAVKWYKGSHEVYRFLPKEFPPKFFFPGKGLTFDEKYCNEHEILLKNVSLETSGKFKCSVSAETSFQTFISSHELKVVQIAIGDTPPIIAVEQLSYYPGETAKANCSLSSVSHDANFTWFMNGKEVPRSLWKQVSIPESSSPALFTSISLLQFEMGANVNSLDGVGVVGGKEKGSLNGDDTRLQCKAELFSLYSETSKELVIQTTQPRYSPSNQDTLRRSSPAINVSNRGTSMRNLIALFPLSMLPFLFVTQTPNYFR